jgi:hypothetical protein
MIILHHEIFWARTKPFSKLDLQLLHEKDWMWFVDDTWPRVCDAIVSQERCSS